MTRRLTLHDLLLAVNESARTEAEAVATLVHLVNSGRVRLGGALRGARIDLADASVRTVLAGAA